MGHDNGDSDFLSSNNVGCSVGIIKISFPNPFNSEIADKKYKIK